MALANTGLANTGLGITDEHVALADAVRGWATSARVTASARLTAEAPDEQLPGWWGALAAQELLALAQDAGVVEVAVVLEQLGRALAPGPYLPTMLTALLVARHGSGVADELSRGIADGSLPAGVALGAGRLGGRRDGDDIVVGGGLDVVLGGATARLVLAPVDVDGGGETWCVIDADGLQVAGTTGVDPTRRVARVAADDVRVPAGRVLQGLTSEAVQDLAKVLVAAEAAGVAGWCLDTAVEYAKVREQFGRPIGAFQAIKHRCAQMLTQVELARAAAWDAASAAADDAEDAAARSLTAEVAAAVALDAAVDCAKSCIQVLGGIGYTWEHDAHLYLKRAAAARQLLGGTGPARRRAAALARDGVRRSRSVELPEQAEAVRTEVREFIAGLGEDKKAWRRQIADAGYLVPHWPKPYGRDAGPVEQLVVEEEFARAGVRRANLIIGNWALPTILKYGTDEQRSRFVPPTLYGEISWCQMFSEPGAGSDLASLQTKAIRVDGGWSLSGQKVWTSTAQYADWAICLARTGAGESRHDGITYFLVDMRSDGIDIRPLRELTGDALFNEVFLTDVFVPDDCVVGEVGGGWRLARTTLANERVAMSSGAAFPSGVEELLGALAASGQGDDPAILDRVGGLLCLAQAESILGLRATLAQVSGTDPGAASSVRKLVGMHLRQDVTELTLELHGAAVLTGEEPARMAAHQFLSSRALTIAGGTSEVLRNVIGERILGLPRS
jgi:alkylation response protein AidB-like acyl-CoA dehydrogenase